MNDAAAPTTPAQATEGDYVRALTRFGDDRPLVVAQPIYSATGIKLLDTGARIDSRVFDRLFNHQLAAPIDQCVTTPAALRPRDVAERALALVTALPALDRLTAKESVRARVLTALAACPLPPAMGLRLTVAQQTAPALYEHSLRAAFAACAIGAAAHLADRDLQVLATAALLHDIGMLHVAPDLFHEGQPLSVEARRHLYAHPVTGAMVARSDPELSPAIAEAIVQHHERLDGTGYPRGLHGEQIGRLARVLMVVEVALAVFERDTEQPEIQLSLILRLNHHGFDRSVVSAVLGLMPRLDPGAATTGDDSTAVAQVETLMQAWDRVHRAAAADGHTDARGYIAERIGRLRRLLNDAGCAFETAAQLAADTAAETEPLDAERCALGREALWQIRQIAYDAAQRWPQCAASQATELADTTAHWIGRALRIGGAEG